MRLYHIVMWPSSLVQVELVEADAREADLLERLAQETDRADRMAPVRAKFVKQT